VTTHSLKIFSENFVHEGIYKVTLRSTMQDTYGILREETFTFDLEMVHWCTMVIVDTR